MDRTSLSNMQKQRFLSYRNQYIVENQWTDFYMIRISVMKELIWTFFFCFFTHFIPLVFENIRKPLFSDIFLIENSGQSNNFCLELSFFITKQNEINKKFQKFIWKPKLANDVCSFKRMTSLNVAKLCIRLFLHKIN